MARSLRTISVWRGRCLRRSPTSSASARSARVRTRTRRASSWSGCCRSMGYPAAGGLADRRVLRRRHACAATRSDAGPRHLKLSHRELSGGTTRCRAADQGVHLRQKCWHGDLAGSRRVAGDPALTGPELEARLAGPSLPARRGRYGRVRAAGHFAAAGFAHSRLIGQACALDLHPRAFGAGAAAESMLGRAGAIVLAVDAPRRRLPHFPALLLRPGIWPTGSSTRWRLPTGRTVI
jgi:hypothetical protein